MEIIEEYPIQYKEMVNKICNTVKKEITIDNINFKFSQKNLEYYYRYYNSDCIKNKEYYYVSSIYNGLGNWQELYMNNKEEFKIKNIS